jgi:hypothetical protein
MDDVRKSKLANLSDAVYMGTKTVNGEDCHHLHSTRADQHVFISQSKSTILKMEENYIFEPGSAEKAARAYRFCSFSFFVQWFQIFVDLHISGDERCYLNSTTVYDEISLNPDIPLEFFSETEATFKFET